MNMKSMNVLFLLLFVSSAVSTVIIDAIPYDQTDDMWTDVNNLVKTAQSQYTAFDLISFVKGYGYPMEQHNVVTAEGYNLTLHRIAHGRYGDGPKTRPAVLLMHGILSTSAEFLTIGPERSLALQLADLDYDIWLGNNRGNTYSRSNDELEPDYNSTFWDFSFHEMGTEDLPKIIDYILQSTGNKKLSYVGYSQGSSQVFALLATQQGYNEKINLVTALAPVAFMSHITSPLARLAADNILLAQALLGKGEVLAHSFLITFLLSIICYPKWEVEICPLLVYVTVGFDSVEMDKEYLQKYFQTFPGGTSAKSIGHYMQLIKSGKFAQYNYGLMGNIKRYKQKTPPEYNISNIKTPVALFYGENDWFSSTKDVELLQTELGPTCVHAQKIAHKFFNHLDFLIAKDLNKLLNFDVINLINEYNGKPKLTTSTAVTEQPTTATTQHGGSGGVAINLFCLLPVLIISFKYIYRIAIST